MRNIFYGSSLILLTACAIYSDWKPTIDPHNDPHANRIERDLFECKQLSINASGDGAEETTKGAVLGGLLGAVSGAAIGAVSGNVGNGAALGATIGGFGGGTKKGFEADGSFKEVFKKCMQYRGHTVLD
ncbi:MAG: glycine zipper family protein [Methylococcales bacterium]|nr:glycine zipper family protein [Methylococcales bacterium]MBT6794552.1 glycine zipper family protein [Methylococcales bacterium]MBT7968087.1 glycine zipper family protein [Methylococcales bacterium]